MCNTHTHHMTHHVMLHQLMPVTVAHTRRDLRTEEQLSACIGWGGDGYKMSAILEIARWHICHAVE